MDTKVDERITQLRDELHQLAKKYEYDFSNKEVLKKSVELDKALNLHMRKD